MTKFCETLSKIAAVTFCACGAVFMFWAASIINHVPGYQFVQASVLLVAFCYSAMALTFAWTFAR